MKFNLYRIIGSIEQSRLEIAQELDCINEQRGEMLRESDYCGEIEQTQFEKTLHDVCLALKDQRDALIGVAS